MTFLAKSNEYCIPLPHIARVVGRNHGPGDANLRTLCLTDDTPQSRKPPRAGGFHCRQPKDPLFNVKALIVGTARSGAGRSRVEGLRMPQPTSTCKLRCVATNGGGGTAWRIQAGRSVRRGHVAS